MAHSKEFLEGYNFCATFGSRSHNPYYSTIQTNENGQKFDDWHEGWNTRFYSEPCE